MAGVILCESCMAVSINAPPSRCYRCHKLTKQSQVCQTCRRATGIQHVWIASEYHDISKQIIQALKFERVQAGAAPIAGCIDKIMPVLPSETIVVHIPTANSRVRRRGYDQAKLIAKNLAASRQWRHETLLLRRGSLRQVGSSRKQRFQHQQKAFIAIKPQNIKGAHILLIDDVTTTGATLESAAKALRAAGAKIVDVAVFAQAV